MVRNGPLEPREGARRAFWPWRRRVTNRRVQLTPRPLVSDERMAEVKGQARRGAMRLLRVAAALAAAGAVGGGVFGAYRWLTTSAKFAVRDVVVAPTRHVSADAVRARAGIEPGTNLFAIDLEEATRNVQADPWVARATARRELPDRVAIDVVERVPACVVAFGALYLADARVEAFKRATPDEAPSLPVVTGVPRDQYVSDREAAQALVREALAALAVWRERSRPEVGEIHVDAAAGITIYTARGVGVRIGRAEGADPAPAWRSRLERYDAVAAALDDAGEKASLILVDQKRRPDRVTVKLASR